MKRLYFLLCIQIACGIISAGAAPITSNSPDAAAVKDAATSEGGKSAKSDIAPDPTERNIARLVARMLEKTHYSQRPLDEAVSSKFFDEYLETLDSMHIYFLQSDIQEFEKYRNTMGDMVLRKGDTSPAHIIFARLMQRVEQRVQFATNLLQTEKFEFKGNDRFNLNRKSVAYPKDIDDAHQLWRQYVRYEFLEEKLSDSDAKADAKTKDGHSDLKFTPKNENQLTTPKTKTKPSDAQASKKKPAEEITKKIASHYTRLERSLKELTHDEVSEIYLTALCHIYDPHTDYMGHSQLENFAISMKLSLFGIGAVLEQSVDGYCQIKELVAGAPAEKSHQLHVQDKIAAVAQGDDGEPVEVVDMKLSKAVELIRGPKGTTVRLIVIPHDAEDSSVRKTVSLVRDQIKLEDQEAKAKIIEVPGKDKPVRLGLIDLNSFYEDMDARKGEHKSTSADVAKLLRRLNQEHVGGVILDLRRNGGGSLAEAIKLTGLFIKKGPVVQTKDYNGTIIVESDTDSGIAYDGPLIVLTSRFSASASEILAGALQDYGRALIVGDSSTHGKGTVQSMIKLDSIMDDNKMPYDYDPGALKLTIRKFYRASGSSTQLKGVIPEIILPSINNYAEVGEVSLDNPLPWDEITSAKYDKLNWVQPYVLELRKLSEQRVQTDKDFQYIREDIERYRKALADKSVSLNEEQRRKEKAELKQSLDARKKERKGRPASQEKVYDVTLKNYDAPVLQVADKTAKPEHAVDASSDDLNKDEADDKTPVVDTTLEESKRILMDFMTLSAKEPHALTATK